MLYNPTLFNGMAIFVEVINSGSFTRAANRTGHSTSYMSKELNKLESRLGVRLMQRTTRSLALTPEGEIYFQQCQQIISAAEEAENLLTGKQLQPKGTLRVSCPTSFGVIQMGHIFSGFMEAYPEINLELDLSNRKVDLVSEGIDISIRATNQLEDSSLVSRLLSTSSSVTLASPAYLQRFGTPQHPSELEQHKLISYSYISKKNQWVYFDQQQQRIPIEQNNRVVTNSTEMELSLCLAGQGITRIPDFYLTDQLRSGKLVELFTDYQRPIVNMYLVYPSRKHMSSKVRCFIDYVLANLNNCDCSHSQ